MASAAAAPPDPDAAPIHAESLPTVDLRGLTQSELFALSRCTASSFDPLRCDDVVIPKIDRSVFNESAGSRKQTYSRLRLAPASSSAASGSQPPLRRRLRHGGGIPYQYFDSSEPDKGENQQIVSLFKQLFGVNSNAIINEESEELVPIRVEYSSTEPLMAEQICSTVPITVEQAQIGLSDPVGAEHALQSGSMKRKRGRPRKNEVAFPVTLVENKVEVELASPVNNQVTVFESEVRPGPDAELDKGILNKDGVVVDLVALGAMMDPYEPEIMRRTKEMVTEEQLLEFLGGIGGKWGTSRKKRRIVDANEFGNVLPNGWSLLLYVKKKAGLFWIYCRRYISPSGRQFETCKEISSYLLSLCGMQDSNQLPCTQSNTVTETVSSMDFGNAVDLAAGDQAKEENLAGKVASAAPPESSTFPLEVAPSKTENLPAVQVAEVTYCGKCNTSFPTQDDYFQHQLSSHRRKRPKSSISDGVIVRGGKFECQFCHKTFVERHRYNGHVGAHVRYHGKSPDDQPAPPASDLVSQGTLAKTPQGSSGSESAIAPEILSSDVVHAPKPYSPRASKQQGEFKELTDRGVDATTSNLSLNSEPFPDNCENNNSFESYNDATITNSVVGGTDNGIDIPEGTDKIEGISDEIVVGNNKFSESPGRVTECYTPFPVDEKTTCSDLFGSKENLVTSNIDLDVPLSDRNDEPGFEDEKYVSNVSVCDFDDNDGGLDLSSGMGDQQHLESEDLICKNGDDVHDKPIFPDLGSEGNDKPMYPDLGPEGNMSSGYNSTGVEFEDENIYTFAGMESGKSGNGLPSFAAFELNSGLEQYPDGVSAGQAEESKGSEAHYLTEDDLMFSFDSSSNPKKMDTQSTKKHERSLEFRSFFPSQSDSVTNYHSNAVEERKNQHFLPESLIPRASHQSYGMENIYTTQVEQTKLNDGRNSKTQELSLASDSRQNCNNVSLGRYPSESFGPGSGMKQMMGSQGNLNMNFNVGPVSHSESFGPGSGMKQMMGGQGNLNMNSSVGPVSHSESFGPGSGMKQMMGGQGNLNMNSRAGPATHSEIFGLGSGMKQMMGTQGNLNMNSHVRPASHSESFGPGSGMKQMIGGQGNLNLNSHAGTVNHSAFSDRSFGFVNMMAGFDGMNTQMPGGLWRTGEQFHAPAPPVQPYNFDIISNKGEGLYGVNQKYDAGIGFESLRSGKMQPIEYSFMTGQGSGSSSLPGESKGFQYGVNTGQGFDSSFWLGREALMPNVGNPRQVSTLCVWCRREFYQEPLPTGAQNGGEIGSICPSCSSKDFNL